MKKLEGFEIVNSVLGGPSVYWHGPCITCPKCRSEYTHIVRAGTLVGVCDGEATVIPGTEPVGQTDVRRSAVEIVFECEMCRKVFSVVIQQHKGVNYLHVRTGVRKLASQSAMKKAAAFVEKWRIRTGMA